MKFKEFSSLIDEILREVIDSTIIEGGHYELKKNKKGRIINLINPESTLTFRFALELYTKALKKGKKVGLSFIVNDFAEEQDKREHFRKNFKLDKKYMDILKEYNINPRDIIFFFEANLRNKGKKTIKEELKKERIIEWGRTYRLNPKVLGIADLISNNAEKSKRVPNCRLILGQELKAKEKMGFKRAINFCNSEVYKCSGRYALVYQKLLNGNMNVVNVYLKKNKEDMEVQIQKYLIKK